MKILLINDVYYGSTGKIVRGISKTAEQEGHSTFIAYSWTKIHRKSVSGNEFVGSLCSKVIHMAFSRIFGFNGWLGIVDTLRLLKRLRRKGFTPDIVNLHMMHASGFCLPILFKYFKKNNIPVVWTMHDMWVATGGCYYSGSCEQWQSGCQGSCAVKKALISCPAKQWGRKFKTFTSVDNMVVVTPSNWLAGLLKQSYLQRYPIEVINNGIDLTLFKPRTSDFRERNRIQDRFVVLSVALGWDLRKGVDIMLDLASKLDNRFIIVMVGTTQELESKLPSNVISIRRTANQIELSEVYSAADLFIIPTRQDNFPTVNIEALACGTPVISFNTGGSPEMLTDLCGRVTMENSSCSMYESIIDVYNKRPYKREDCRKQALKYDENDRFKEYVQLFSSMKTQ